MLDRQDVNQIGRAADVWEKVVKKLQLGMMPPLQARRPDSATYARLIGFLTTRLDEAARLSPNPGRPVLHRLNRTEYANSIRDLLSLNVDVTTLLPPDDAAYGFDNVSDVLGVSPLLLERYLGAAGQISALAVGDPEIGPGSDTYRVRQDLSQDQRIEGLPLGTVGGIVVEHLFPSSAEYQLQVQLFRNNLNIIRGLESANELEIAVDGKRVLLTTIGGPAESDDPKVVESRLHVRVSLTAGPHRVSAAFLRKGDVGTERVEPFLRSSIDTFDATGRPHVEGLTIAGPFNGNAAGDTASRRMIFVCRPKAPGAEKACAETILHRLARRAYRRSVDDRDLQPILQFYEVGRKKGTFDAGIQMGLRRILASPDFVFRAERDPVGVPSGTIHSLTDEELASRLSFFLWSSIPDDLLLAVARANRLHEPSVLAAQVTRMLADPKAQALTANFAGQWLHLRNLRTLVPNSNEFPDFDDNLRQAFQRETELFFESIIHENRSVLDLLDANYTFVNERLAKHYGIDNIYGTHFRRIVLTDDSRRGLLGKGAILMVTSHADRTSPVVRGKWVLENLIGAPPAPPPPNVPPLKEAEEGSRPKTMREQMEEHRAAPTCAGCHKIMDPIGFSLENFDAIGAWRSHDAGIAIDASGQLADGRKINGVLELRQALLAQPDVFVSTLVEKLLTYGLGRGVGASDMPAVRAIVRDASRDDYRFSSLILAIVRSVPFRLRSTPTAGDAAGVN